MTTENQIDEFIIEHRLPGRFRHIVDKHYLQLAAWISKQKYKGKTFLLGINGAQGTGKSTLAELLQLVLEKDNALRVALLSIDDFYLGKKEREQQAVNIHPLLRTRGAPGTHDVKMMTTCIEKLRSSDQHTAIAIPRFDKSTDNQSDAESWPVIDGPVDLVILEGWCVGSMPQSNDQLSRSINTLEEHEDPSGKWRRYVNEKLAGCYAELFAKLDALVFLKAPGFDAVYRWRLEQEQKLAAIATGNGSGIMNADQISRFIQHYERITRNDFALLPEKAAVVLELDDAHDCVRSVYSNQTTR